MANKNRTAQELILEKMDELSNRITNIESVTNANRGSTDLVVHRLAEENAVLKREISFVSAQIEGLFATLSKMLQKMPEKISDSVEDIYNENSKVPVDVDLDDFAVRVANKINLKNGKDGVVATVPTPTSITVDANNMDYDTLGYAIAKRLYIPQALVEEVDYALLAEEVAKKLPPVHVDYEELGFAIAKRIYVPQAIAEDVDYDEIARKVIEKLPELTSIANAVSETAYASAEPQVQSVQAEIDYDKLAEKVAEVVSTQEVVSPDYIASRVAEQIVIPQSAPATADVNLDVEELSRKVADKIVIPAYEQKDVNEERIAEAVCERLHERESYTEATPASYETSVDEQALAENIASRLNFSLSDELIAAAVVKNLADAIDSDEIADCVAKRVGSISPEQFEITVDDDGCESLAGAVESKLNYELLAASVAEKLNPALMTGATAEVDAEEIARSIAEKLNVNADIDEDSLADKAAAILSNYLPEVDSAEIADKVVAGIIPALPATPVVDNEGIAYNVSERIMQSQEENEYDIVIDDEGLTKITDGITENIARENEEKYQKLEGELTEFKDEYGKRLDQLAEDVTEVKSEHGKRFDKLEEDVADIKGEYDSRFDKLDADIDEIKRMLMSGIVVASTVQSVGQPVEVGEEVVTTTDENSPDEGTPFRSEGAAQEEEEEQLVTVSDVVGEQVDDGSASPNVLTVIDENLTDGEIMPDGIGGGVDFLHMMKYDRSFIARIIQGTDEQKNYYGQVKMALLSYKKVNSNVAWGSERFNKGRETIARFKIRGKTLCLYLALDPKEFEYSVYHHADVSDNKSVHGTPMMVKVKSPLGVKKAIRLIDIMLAKRDGIKHNVPTRDYAMMYPFETIEELIEDGLVKDVNHEHDGVAEEDED